MKNSAAIAVLLFGLVACETTPAARIAVLQETYRAAGASALAYMALPLCDKPGQQPPCSAKSVVRYILKANEAANLALKTARKTSSADDYEKARQAVYALSEFVDFTTSDGELQ